MEIELWKIIATFFLGILVLIVTKVWDPIAEDVGNPFDVRRRVKNSADAVEWLGYIQVDLLDREPYPSSRRFKGWLKRVQDMCPKLEKIKAGHNGCGLNYFRKCYFGKEADKELEKATDLIVIGKELLEEAQARPPRPGRHALPEYPNKKLRGMDSYEYMVRGFIEGKGTQPQLLGIWGMGGVGKTSLLQSLRDSFVGKAPFVDRVLLVRVGREGSVGRVQKVIADSMGLPILSDDETSQGDIIYNHLKDKDFLLLIDDLWKGLDLEAVGIPMPLGTPAGLPPGGGAPQQYQRKVVFTTRSEDVCGEMECTNNTIRLECLSGGDAWDLFVDKVGKQIINDSLLEELARKLMDECSGLPMALCTIGRAMSTKKDPKEWRYAIDLLKKSKLFEINSSDDLFTSLKLSFDNLPKYLKECFLICALWPRDRGENIPMEKLVEWWTGLGFLDASTAIFRGYSNIHTLVRLSMLDKGDNSLYSSERSHVKMHQVTRMVALWIVNDRGEKDRWLPYSFCRSSLPLEKWSTVQKAWISSADSSRWSSSITCLDLTMLVSRHAFSFKECPCFQNITFLDLEGTKQDIFPLEICVLKNLKYLNLSATTIGALPLKLQELSNLIYLYIRDIGALQIVPEELISQLAKLRVLDLFCSGSISNKNPCFSSLIEGLSKNKNIDLILGITVHTKADIVKLRQLKREVQTQALCMHHFEDECHPHIIDLELLSHFENLRELAITNSSDIQQLVAKGKPDFVDPLTFLEILELRNLLKLQKVTWKNAGEHIRVLVIYNCTELEHVTWVHCLRYLEELTIADCSKLEKVIDNAELSQEMESNLVVGFGRLKKLYLEKLPRLSIVSDQSFPFEELLYVYVAKCEILQVIRVKRINQHKINIYCDKSWWARLGENFDTVGDSAVERCALCRVGRCQLCPYKTIADECSLQGGQVPTVSL